jgi:hypothetical protein
MELISFNKIRGRSSIRCQNGPVLPPAQVFHFNGQALLGNFYYLKITLRNICQFLKYLQINPQYVHVHAHYILGFLYHRKYHYTKKNS